MLTLRRNFREDPEIVVRPSLAECGVNWVCEGRNRPPGASSWPLPYSGWALANAPQEKANWDAPSGRQRLALWRAIWIRSLHASWSCWRAAISRGGLPGGQCHTAPPILERRKGQSRSVHVGRRHTSRLKPRTSSGRVIDSSLFHLLVGTRISVEKPLKNSTNAYYFQQISIGASL
jgi:hypothetical protein